MRPSLLLIPSAMLLLTACQPSPEEAVAEAMNQALDALHQGNGETYVSMMADYHPDDSLRNSLIALAVKQQHHLDLQQHGGPTHATIDSIALPSDTTALAFYTNHYADGDSSYCCQQLSLREGVWKLQFGLER